MNNNLTYTSERNAVIPLKTVYSNKGLRGERAREREAARGEALEASLSRFAVPSWITPGGIAENARFAAGRAAEVGLCFFETEACLAYGESDLPADLAELPLSWHVHLPLDLPWSKDEGVAAAKAALALMDKAAFLKAGRAVVHLPEGLGRSAAPAAVLAWENFMIHWQNSGRSSRDILLENQPGDEPQALLNLAEIYDAGLCLDFSHWLLTCGPEILPGRDFLQRVALVHLNAPGYEKTGHAALTELFVAEQAWAAAVLREFFACRAQDYKTNRQDDIPLMLEIFSWDKIVASLPLLQTWLAGI